MCEEKGMRRKKLKKEGTGGTEDGGEKGEKEVRGKREREGNDV